MKKIKKEDIIKYLDNQGYIIIGEYKNANTKVECLQKKTNYKVMVSYSELKYGKTPSIFGKTNPFRDYNIGILVKNKNSNVELLNVKTIKHKNKVRILCELKCSCGNKFNKLLDDIQSNKRNLECKECYSKNRPIKRMKNLQKDRMKLISDLGYELLSDVEYFKNTDILLLKDKNGYIGKSTYANLQRGDSMTVFSMNTNKENFIYNANVYCNNNNIKTEVIGFANEEKWTRQGIKCKCECGKIFETSIASFMHTKTRCDDCSNRTSRWSKAVEDFLKENNIVFKKEYIFNDCRDILPLPFDYHIEFNNSLIEVDGEQHDSKENYKFVKTDEEKEYWFNKQKEHDNIKTNFCKEKGIKLLRISYKDVIDKTYKNKIIQFIKG